MFSWKAIIVARREYSSVVRTRAFIFGLVLAPLLMAVGVFLAPSGDAPSDAGPRQVVLVDQTGELAASLGESLSAAGFELVVPAARPEDTELAAQLQQQVRDGAVAAVVEVGPDAFAPERDDTELGVVLTVRNLAHQSTSWLHQTLDGLVQLKRLEAAGLDSARARRILGGAKVQLRLPDSDGKTGLELAMQAAALPLLTLMVAFFAIISSAPYMLHSVVEEKQQRITEVLLGSMSPTELMTGKLLGAAGAGLTVVAVYALMAGAGAVHFGIDLELRPGLVLFGLFDVLLALVLFGSLFLAAGAAATEIKDAQGFMMPLTLLLTLPMLTLSELLGNPDGGLATGLSLFPLTAPLILPVRMATTSVPIWQVGLSVIGALVFTCASVWAAGRIFRIGILSQGRAPRLGELWQWIRSP